MMTGPLATLKAISIVAAAQPIMIIALLLSDATSIGSQVIAGIVITIQVFTGAGVLALFFRMGKYVGTNDATIVAINASVNRVEHSLDLHVSAVAKAEEQIVATQHKHSESLVELRTKVVSMEQDIRLVRDRQHDFASILTKLTLQPVHMREHSELD